MAKEGLFGTKAVWTQISISWESGNCLWLLNDSFSSLPSCPLAGFQKALLTVPPSYGYPRGRNGPCLTPSPRICAPSLRGIRQGRWIQMYSPKHPTPLPCKAAQQGHSPACCFPWPCLSGCCPSQSWHFSPRVALPWHNKHHGWRYLVSREVIKLLLWKHFNWIRLFSDCNKC